MAASHTYSNAFVDEELVELSEKLGLLADPVSCKDACRDEAEGALLHAKVLVAQQRHEELGHAAGASDGVRARGDIEGRLEEGGDEHVIEARAARDGSQGVECRTLHVQVLREGVDGRQMHDRVVGKERPVEGVALHDLGETRQEDRRVRRQRIGMRQLGHQEQRASLLEELAQELGVLLILRGWRLGEHEGVAREGRERARTLSRVRTTNLKRN